MTRARALLMKSSEVNTIHPWNTLADAGERALSGVLQLVWQG